MSQKSLNSILKAIITDSGAATRDRLRALRDLEHPSARFLQRVLSDPELPAKLKVAAYAMLESLQSKSQAGKEPKAPEPFKLPPPEPRPQTPAGPVLGATQLGTSELAGEIDAELYDILDLGNGVRGCTRGPDHPPSTPTTLTEPECKPHGWREM